MRIDMPFIDTSCLDCGVRYTSGHWRYRSFGTVRHFRLHIGLNTKP